MILASYATGAVSGTAAVGGLVGSGRARVGSSYWDLETSGVRVGVGEYDTNDNGVMDGSERHLLGVAGMTTAELQGPRDYTGVYETWNIDLDRSPFSDGEADDPWDFGTSVQYPVLSVDVDDIGGATWQEFGYQLRGGPTLTATTTAGQAQVSLTWTAVDTSGWRPAPSVIYTVHRDNGSSIETVADDLAGLAYTDTGVTVGTRYRYRVAAVVDGGERVRSAWVSVTAGRANQGPVPVGILADRMLELGASAVEVDVAGAFHDPDSDTLTYAASSSVTSVAAVSRSGSLVTITPGNAGVTVITVTATDAGGSATSATQRFTVRVGYDYDSDGDGLIEIETLAQLDAVRLDLNGNGRVDADDDAATYAAAFPSAFARLGCGVDGCSGYELEADLDFDTNGNGSADAGDAYWNDGAGWEPVGLPYGQFFGTLLGAFRTTFEGNGHTLSNLFVDGGHHSGLFGALRASGVVRNVRLVDVDVTGEQSVGGLAGVNGGTITGSRTTGEVAGENRVGGLVGENTGTIALAGSVATVTGKQPPLADADLVAAGVDWVAFRKVLQPATGGLVGDNSGAIRFSHATGRVAGDRTVGGLAGENSGTIGGSYSTGRVTGERFVGGLVGRNGILDELALRIRQRADPCHLRHGRRVGRGLCRRVGRGQQRHHHPQLCRGPRFGNIQRVRAGGRPLQRCSHRELLGQQHLGPHDRNRRPDDCTVAGADRLHGHLRDLERGSRRRRRSRRSLGLRGEHPVSGPGRGHGRERTGDLAGVRPPGSRRADPDGDGIGDQDAGAGAGRPYLDRRRRQPMGPGAGRELFRHPRGR